MKNQIYTCARIAVIWIVLGLSTSEVWSQSSFFGPNKPTGVFIDLNKPSFDGDFYAFSTSSLFITGVFRLSDGLRGIVELPLAYTDIKEDFGGRFADDFSGAAIGSPYVGVSTERPDTRAWFEAGLRLPLTSGDGWMAHAFTSNLDRTGSFSENLVSVSAGGNFVFGSQPVSVHVRVRPNVLLPTGSNNADSELFVDYSGFAWLNQEKVDVGMGIQGWTVISESGLSFGQRSVHEFGLAANVKLNTFRVGGRITIPLDEDRKGSFNNIFGLVVTIPIPNAN